MTNDERTPSPHRSHSAGPLASIRARLAAPLRREWFAEIGSFGDDFFSDD